MSRCRSSWPEGRGAVVAFSELEERLRAEQVLREHDAVLARQEASLRRIATLVAGGPALGGTLELDSTPGNGTSLAVTLPLK
jgi:hypothetical protein